MKLFYHFQTYFIRQLKHLGNILVIRICKVGKILLGSKNSMGEFFGISSMFRLIKRGFNKNTCKSALVSTLLRRVKTLMIYLNAENVPKKVLVNFYLI